MAFNFSMTSKLIPLRLNELLDNIAGAGIDQVYGDVRKQPLPLLRAEASVTADQVEAVYGPAQTYERLGHLVLGRQIVKCAFLTTGDPPQGAKARPARVDAAVGLAAMI